MTTSELPRPSADELAGLRAFDQGRDDYYATGFELTEPDDVAEISAGWTEAPEWVGRLTPIGIANGSGSVYAHWAAADGSFPVVVLGDEGGVRVVAVDTAQFLRLLSLDAEPMVDWESVDYYNDGVEDPSPGHADYVAWLTAQGLEPLEVDHDDLDAEVDDDDDTDDTESDGDDGNDEATAIVAAAAQRYGDELATWVKAQGFG